MVEYRKIEATKEAMYDLKKRISCHTITMQILEEENITFKNTEQKKLDKIQQKLKKECLELYDYIYEIIERNDKIEPRIPDIVCNFESRIRKDKIKNKKQKQELLETLISYYCC